MTITVKKLLLPLLILLTAFIGLDGQTVSVENSTVIYEKQTIPAVKVTMDPTPDKVKEEFRDYIKDRYDVKMKGIGFLSNKETMSAEQVTVTSVSPNTMDFYTKVVDNGQRTEMYVFGKFGYDMYISRDKYPSEYNNLKEIAVAFAKDFLPDYYQNRVDEAEEMLTDLRKDRNKLTDDIADNEKKIKELQKETEDKKRELTQLEENIKDAESQLGDRRDGLRSVNSSLSRQ